MHDVWLALWASAKIGFKFQNLELAKMLKKHVLRNIYEHNNYFMREREYQN